MKNINIFFWNPFLMPDGFWLFLVEGAFEENQFQRFPYKNVSIYYKCICTVVKKIFVDI